MRIPTYLSWRVYSYVIVFLVALPLLTLLWLAMSNTSAQHSIWQHLYDTVLTRYISNSLILMLSVGFCTAFLGIGSAWLISQYRFWGRDVASWALLLPMALPGYIVAYCYTGLFDVAGPVQSVLREAFQWQYGDYWFFEIRSLGGATFTLSFVLYPYVYLLARNSFLNQSNHIRQAAQLCGLSATQAFFKVTLPIARPAIVVGLALVMMETLADFGTVSYFGVDTLTTGIFRTWSGLDSLENAAQLALLLLGFVAALLLIEKTSRRKASYAHAIQKTHSRHTLSCAKNAMASIAISIPIIIGFIIPVAQLLYWVILTKNIQPPFQFLSAIQQTLFLGIAAAIIIVILGALLSYAKRVLQNRTQGFLVHIASLGYAIPGIVIAVGIIYPINSIENNIDAWTRAHWGYSTGLFISGTTGALLLAYIVRFLSVSLQTIETGFSHIHQNIDHAAKILGSSPTKTLQKIHMPLLKTSFISAGILVFVDVIKELPATLLLRPFNVNTLAVQAYELASDEQLAQAAIPSLCIVCVGLIPVIILSKAMQKSA